MPRRRSSIAIEFTIGTGNPVPVSRVYSISSTPQTSGTVTQSNGATLRIHH